MGKKIEDNEQKFTRAIGERAARVRKERGITQKQMAERLGVSQPHVSFIENGVTRLHGEMLAKLARILDVSADELLGLKPDKPRAGTARIAPASSRKLLRILQRVEDLPERDQRAVLRLISSLSASGDLRHDR